MEYISVEGVVLPNKSLSNFEIDDAVNKLNIPHYTGWYSRDDPIEVRDKECFILNLDDSKGGGTHWVAFVKYGDKKFYFDSYGLQPPSEIVNRFKSPIYYNSDIVQPDYTVICGHLCLLFLRKMLEKGKPTLETFQSILNNLL